MHFLCGFFDYCLAEDLIDLYGEERRKTLKLFPEALRVLAFLRKKYRLGLVTNGPSDVQRAEIEDLQTAEYFHHIIIAEEVRYAKPDPRIFHLLITTYTISSNQILYVGNSPREDGLGAYQAGLKVAWLNRKSEMLGPGIPRPHYEVTILSELLDVL